MQLASFWILNTVLQYLFWHSLCIKAVHIVPRTQGWTPLSHKYGFLGPITKRSRLRWGFMLFSPICILYHCIIQMSHKLLTCIKTHLGKIYHWHSLRCLDSANQVHRSVFSLDYFWRAMPVSKEKFSPKNKPGSNNHALFFLHVLTYFKQEM